MLFTNTATFDIIALSSITTKEGRNMKVLVLNGSPKGQNSVTLQYAKYLEKISTQNCLDNGFDFDYINVGKNVYSYSNADKLQEVLDKISEADMLVVAYPVYTFLAPSQLHRFFEILDSNSVKLTDKYVVQVTTSKRFYDVTAHQVVKDIVCHLEGKYVDGYSADMDDLLNDDLRAHFKNWWDYVLYRVNNDIYESARDTETTHNTYLPTAEPVAKTGGKKVVVVTDNTGNSSLAGLISDFVNLCPYDVEVVDLKSQGPKSGCRGCLKCAQTGVCVIKDGFSDLLNDKINKADAVIMAFEVVMHGISSTFKAYYDRQFVNGHRPVTAGQPTAYLVSGNYESESNLKTYVEAKSAVGGNLNCGVVCDQTATAKDVEQLVSKLVYALDNKITPHKNFYEVGGMRIFRDMIWIMRGIMKLDYDYYKKHNMLDFPQKKRGTMIAMKLVGKLMRSKAINKKMPNMMEEGMLMPYKKIVD
jgi:multimeric flavodoxin WrbA